jgi:hypothetical protein
LSFKFSFIQEIKGLGVTCLEYFHLLKG